MVGEVGPERLCPDPSEHRRLDGLVLFDAGTASFAREEQLPADDEINWELVRLQVKAGEMTRQRIWRWARLSRADAGAWAAAEVPLEHVPEAYRVTIFDGAVAVRSIDAAAPSASYGAAEQVADFGALPAAFDFTVQQLSPVFGPGHQGAGAFNA